MAFGKKLSIEDFKAEHNAVKIDVVKNPHTDKRFVSANGKVVAAVGVKWDQTKDSEFAELINDETGEITWCLCNKHTDNVIATL